MKTLLFCLFAVAAFANAPVPNFPLVNQEGKPFQLYDLKGNHIFISFIYSRCPLPNMCPLTMKLTKDLYLKARKDLPTTPFHFLFVTLDPKGDSPTVLKAFAKKHHFEDKKNVTFATGSDQALSDLASQFNVMGIPSSGTISHNMKSALLGPTFSTIKEYKENEWKPEDVVRDIGSSLQ